MVSNPSYLIIGKGRVAINFSYYLDLIKIPYDRWCRSENSLIELTGFSQKHKYILLLISDGAIDSFIESSVDLKGKFLIHFSGTLKTDKALGFHPLFSFTHKLCSLETYKKISFVTDEKLSFQDFFPQLPNKSYQIKTKQKKLYHALCVLSGNFTVLLWQKMFKDLESKLGLKKEIAFPYLKQITENIIDHPETSLTGPFVRNDTKTIEDNQKALVGDPYLDIYQSFLKTYQGGNYESN